LHKYHPRNTWQPFHDGVWRGSAYRLFALISLLIRDRKTTNTVVIEEGISLLILQSPRLHFVPNQFLLFSNSQPISPSSFLILLAYLLLGHQSVLVPRIFSMKSLYLNDVFSQTYLTSSPGFLGFITSNSRQVLLTNSIAYIRELGGGGVGRLKSRTFSVIINEATYTSLSMDPESCFPSEERNSARREQ
jgi:hypothetical protein